MSERYGACPRCAGTGKRRFQVPIPLKETPATLTEDEKRELGRLGVDPISVIEVSGKFVLHECFRCAGTGQDGSADRLGGLG